MFYLLFIFIAVVHTTLWLYSYIILGSFVFKTCSDAVKLLNVGFSALSINIKVFSVMVLIYNVFSVHIIYYLYCRMQMHSL